MLILIMSVWIVWACVAHGRWKARKPDPEPAPDRYPVDGYTPAWRDYNWWENEPPRMYRSGPCPLGGRDV